METLAAPNFATVESDGYAIVKAVLKSSEVDALRHAAAVLFARHNGRAGVRDPVLKSAPLSSASTLPAVQGIARDILGDGARVVRSILFDKTPDANWDVAWHQDVTIAVRERHDVAGFGPWSVKAGVVSLQLSRVVLERMLTIRLHLDDCGPANGPLLVVPQSHRNGLVPVQSLDTAACDRHAVACVVAAGDAVLMRPLTLHASKKSLAVAHRRVLHLDFAAESLPSPLVWYYER